MANQIAKTGAFPPVTVTYSENYRLSDGNVGKFISLIGAKKFYNPGIGFNLQSPNSGTVTTTLNQAVLVTAFDFPSGINALSLGISIDNPVNFNLTIKAYLNYTTQGINSGSGIVSIIIPSGLTTGNVSIESVINISQITNIQPVISDILNGSTSLNWVYGNTTANATVNLIVTQNTPVTGTFTNTLNIPDFNVTSINFYGGGRDTLILKGNKLTS